MHAVLTMTLMHDRFLSVAPYEALSSTEAFHWYQGVCLYRKKLSGTVDPLERSALWATG